MGTEGGMCCDAEYYSANGVGRGTVSEVGAISAYNPPLTGGDMSAETSPGVMCPAHSKDDGYSTTTVGNVDQDNPAETELLEGQAFYVSLAPSQFSLPTTSTTAATQKANEAKQKQCDAHHIHDENEQGGCPDSCGNPDGSWRVWLRVLRNQPSRGLRSLVSSLRGPTWLWLRRMRRVAVPTRLVLLRLLPGTVLRP